MKSAKNGSSKNYRVEANMRAVRQAMSGEIAEAIYAKVLAKMGDARMRIYYEESKRGYEGIGRIRGLLRKRGQVPIQTNDVVIVTPREFEANKRNFDIIAVLSSKEVSDLKKRKEIPDYFIGDVTTDKSNVEFDYSDNDEKTENEMLDKKTENEQINIDNI